jgi:hypothetical protein
MSKEIPDDLFEVSRKDSAPGTPSDRREEMSKPDDFVGPPSPDRDEVLEFEHLGLRCRGGAGRYADQRIGEILLTMAKDCSAADVDARDSAIAASLALQHGCDVQILRRALTRNADGSAAGPLGLLLDQLVLLLNEPDVTGNGDGAEHGA